MRFEKKISQKVKTSVDRVKKTRLYMLILENGKYAISNTSQLVGLLCTVVQTGSCALSARNASIDILHGVENYLCQDYKCWILDGVATACLPVGATIKTVFTAVTGSATFCRMVRTNCK